MEHASAKQAQPGKRSQKTKDLTISAMMVALTIILCLTPLGIIRLPMVSITIAHIPILITAVLFGLPQGLTVAAAFGITSLLIALTNPVSILDPFFVNPLVSILPRLLIPLTTTVTYRMLTKALPQGKKVDAAIVAVSIAVGNLTNTFGVYTMLYLVYAKQIFDISGKPALSLIVGLISSTTLVKCVFVVLICTPVILALKRALRTA